MLFNSKWLKYTSFIIFLLFSISSVNGQDENILDKKINISFSEISLSKALEIISSNAQVNFSYYSTLIPVNRLVSIKAWNKSLRYILDELLNDPTITYMAIGNYIILKRNDSKITFTQIQHDTLNLKTKRPVSYIKTKDTVYVLIYETIRDTIVKIETQTKSDTIIISQIDSSNYFYSFTSTPTLSIKFSPLFLHQQYIATVTMYNDYISMLKKTMTSEVGYIGGLEFSYPYKNFSFQTGGLYMRVNSHFNYQQTLEKTDSSKPNYYNVYYKGNYYIFDTIFNRHYFSIIGNDTTYYYFIDSNRVELYKKYKESETYKTNNHITYITIPINMAYKWQRFKLTYFFNAGILMNIALNNSGKELNKNNQVITLTNEHLKKIAFNYTLGGGINYRFNRQFSLTFETQFIRSANYINTNKEYYLTHNYYTTFIALHYHFIQHQNF